MANTKLPARLLDTSAVPALNVTGDLTVDTTTLVVNSTNNRVGIGNASPNAFLSVRKDNNNSGNQFVVADTEGASPGLRTYTHNGDDSGLILNHYYAIGGSGNEYMRYADFVANVGDGAGTTMRFITKNAANTFTTGLVQDNNGQVGINETAPLAKLHVVGGRANGTVYNTIIAAGGVNSTDGSGARLILSGCENDPLVRGTVIEGISTGTGNSHQLNFKTNNGSNTPTTRMTIGHTGNVGIGTMSPTMGLLEVSGSKYVNTNSGKALGGIHVSPDSAATLGQFGGAISFSAGGNGSSAIAAVNDGGSDNDSTGLAFFVHGSGTGSDDANEVVRIDQLGNVGIGDMSPFAKLHVEDTGWSSGSPYGTIAYIQGGATNDANWGHLLISQSGTTADTGGRLAFGANGENPIAGIRAKYKGATYGDLAFSTRPSGGTNTERMVISSTGNVTKPNQASFNAKSPAVTSGDNTIIFGSERHDTGSNYDASTGIFTAPVAGVYQFHVYVLMNPGNNEYGRVLFRVNNVGSNMESYGDNLTYVAGQPSYFGLGMSANIYMAFQDNIRVYNAGQWATYGTAYGSFSGMLIG